MAAATSELPLHCNICPKKPNFSDVSHLLTHIASKGHLSHYYKIKVRSGHDFNAKKTIDAYDQWYANNHVEHLMSERMHLKDRKRLKPRGQAPLPTFPQEPRAKASTVDPLLATHFTNDSFALEDNPSMISYPPFSPWPNAQILRAPKVYKPSLALWRTVWPRSLVSVTPAIPSSPPELPPYFNVHHGSGVAPQAKMWSNGVLDTAFPSREDEELASEATKLKGVYWPGMDIFDAASPGMKRKRNQKKDTSVAMKLERHSLFVEPTEMIFTPLGSLKKSRLISGQVDFDSSPDKLSTPTPKPKRRQPARLPLSKKDTNASSLAAPAAAIPPFPGYGPVNNSITTNTSRPPKKKKRTFDVFEDENRTQLDSVNNMRFLTAGFRPATHSGPAAGSTAPPTLLDIQTGTMYHNNLFAEAFETFQPTFFGMPYYGHGYYGHNGFGLASLFHNTSHQPSTQQDGPEPSIQKLETTEDSNTISANSDN